MKKIWFLFCLSLIVMADDIPVTPPLRNLSKAYFSGGMTGSNRHMGMIGGKEYPDVWSYYSLASGSRPENFVWTPLKAMSPEHSRAIGWKSHPILTADPTGKKISPAALLGHYFIVSRGGTGCAFAFRNPLDREILLIVEGSLNYNRNADIFIYRKTADGKITLLADNKNKDALRQVSNTFPDQSVRTRYYLKLQLEVKLAKNDSLFFAGRLPEGNPAGRKDERVFYLDDKWGASWNPVFLIGDTEEPAL